MDTDYQNSEAAPDQNQPTDADEAQGNGDFPETGDQSEITEGQDPDSSNTNEEGNKQATADEGTTFEPENSAGEEDTAENQDSAHLSTVEAAPEVSKSIIGIYLPQAFFHFQKRVWSNSSAVPPL